MLSVVVGAPKRMGKENVYEAGAALVFHSGVHYTFSSPDAGGPNVDYQHMMVTAPSPSNSDAFGESVSMSGDGRVIAVSASTADVDAVSAMSHKWAHV